MEKLVLTPNVPVQIALKFSDGKLVEGRYGDQVMFSLTNGQVMYLDTDSAAKINLLEPRKHEPFFICKRTGKKTDSPIIDVWKDAGATPPSPQVQAAAAATGIPVSELERTPAPMPTAPTVGRVVPVNGGGAASQPAAPTAAFQPPSSNGNGITNGNGHNGNGAPHYNGNGTLPPPPVKVGYDVALRRILRVTIAELKTAGEQWSDAARQDLVSTLMIQAARDGVITWLPLTREEGN